MRYWLGARLIGSPKSIRGKIPLLESDQQAQGRLSGLVTCCLTKPFLSQILPSILSYRSTRHLGLFHWVYQSTSEGRQRDHTAETAQASLKWRPRPGYLVVSGLSSPLVFWDTRKFGGPLSLYILILLIFFVFYQLMVFLFCFVFCPWKNFPLNLTSLALLKNSTIFLTPHLLFKEVAEEIAGVLPVRGICNSCHDVFLAVASFPFGGTFFQYSIGLPNTQCIIKNGWGGLSEDQYCRWQISPLLESKGFTQPCFPAGCLAFVCFLGLF